MSRTKLLRKIMICALATVLVIAPAASVKAAQSSSGGAAIVEGNGGATEQEPASATTYPRTSYTSSVRINGEEVKTTVPGLYNAKNVNGVAVVTKIAEMNAALGLKDGERAYAKIIASTYGPLARETVRVAADALNVPVGPVLDIAVAKISRLGGYTYVNELNTAMTVTVGVPDDFAESGHDYAIIRVQEGGIVNILPDTDADSKTITFETDRLGVFALTKAPEGNFDALQ